MHVYIQKILRIFFFQRSSTKACHRSDRQHPLFPSSVSLPCPRRHIFLRAETVQGFSASTRPPKTQGGRLYIRRQHVTTTLDEGCISCWCRRQHRSPVDTSLLEISRPMWFRHWTRFRSWSRLSLLLPGTCMSPLLLRPRPRILLTIKNGEEVVSQPHRRSRSRKVGCGGVT